MGRRLILIVMDSVGIGALPDADLYGDEGSNTLVNTAQAVGGLRLPNLARLGLGNIAAILGVPPAQGPEGNFGRMAERSVGKDSTSGHWELMGLITERPFPTYPGGFPKEVIEPFERAIGREVLGNTAASGTQIIQELGAEHLTSGKPIVYTSADSVFQIAAHLDVISLEELYSWCRIARGLLIGRHAVARVIARPFVGREGSFTRTSQRRDFSLSPPQPTVLDQMKRSGLAVVGIGKIEDLFAGQGLTKAIHAQDNKSGLQRLKEQMGRVVDGAVLVNLVDFDMLWGHRNDPRSYARGLEEFDQDLEGVLSLAKSGDMVIITADHGNDPTTASTDHSREYVPLLVCGPDLHRGIDLGIRETFADVAATVAEYFQLPGTGQGRSFWKEVSLGSAAR